MSTRLPAKDAGEKFMVELDYADEMAAGETIGSVVISMAVLSGTDANPAAMLEGAATIVDRKVFQRVGGGINGNTYKLRAVASISGGNVIVRTGELPIRED